MSVVELCLTKRYLVPPKFHLLIIKAISNVLLQTKMVYVRSVQYAWN
jgi:hypothetical protein